MAPDQRRWLERARELAAAVQQRFKTLTHDDDLVMDLLMHIQEMLDTPEWHGETLATFLKDMLPLADCCASLEARLSVGRQGDAWFARPRLILAGSVSMISRLLVLAVRRRFQAGATPPTALINRLARSASLAVRWWPKALRAAAEREVGQVMQPRPPASQAVPPYWAQLLHMAGEAVMATVTVRDLLDFEGPHAGTLCATLCAPATLASALGNIAAVYACFARFPATFKDQAEEWLKLAMLATSLLETPASAAVAAAVEKEADFQQQLSAALLPYAAHLLDAADLRDAAWLVAWSQLVPALGPQWVWQHPGASVASGAVQHIVSFAERLLHLLRALPPLGKPPGSCGSAWEWFPIPLYTSKAAIVAAATALEFADNMLQARAQRAAALREVQQRGLNTLLSLLPITVNLLAGAAVQIPGPNAGADDTPARGWPKFAYTGALGVLLLLLVPEAGRLLLAWVSAVEEQRLDLQPRELAAAAEAALRFAAQATTLAGPLGVGSAWGENGSTLEGDLTRRGMALGQGILCCLVRAAKQEVSAAPEPGGVRPSLQAQLHCVHTACKFARASLVPGATISCAASSGGFSAEQLHEFVLQYLEHVNCVLVSHVRPCKIPEGREPLTPAEKRALAGCALTLSASTSAVMHLLPDGPDRQIQRVSYVMQLCLLLKEPDLAPGALSAKHTGLAEELAIGLVAAMEDVTDPQATESMRMETLCDCFGGWELIVDANRHIGPMMLGGAAGEVLEEAARQSLQGPAHGLNSWSQEAWSTLLIALVAAAETCFDDSGRAAAEQLLDLLEGPYGPELSHESLEALPEVRAAADEWLAQEAQQQWRQEQLLLSAEAAATRACSNLACTNLAGASEAGLKARQCAGCRCVRYCSTDCQRTDWAAGHKIVCKRLQARQAAGGS